MSHSMNLGFVSDHAAYDLKEFLKQNLIGFKQTDFGCHSRESVDYPDYVGKLCNSLCKREIDCGIVLCGTGIGASIVANRFSNVRAALCHNVYMASMARKHNDANILAMGARTTGEKTALLIAQTFLKEKFEGERHIKRIQKIELVAEQYNC